MRNETGWLRISFRIPHSELHTRMHCLPGIHILPGSLRMIAPSILSADFAKLGELVREVEAAGANRIHVDVMDGHFVPNLSMGAVVVKGLRPVTKKPLEVHLMVEDPGRFLDGFVKAGADTLIVHLEVLPDPRPMLDHVRRALNKKVGLAFNPDVPVAKVEPYLRDIDLALCMTV